MHIYVSNQQDQYLVHLRSPLKDLNPNKWDSHFGGHVKAGSTYEETVLEELKQEIGLTIKLQDLKSGTIIKYDGGTNREFILFYFYMFDGNIADLHFSDNEVVAVKWMTPDEIVKEATEHPEQWIAYAKNIKNIITGK